MKHMAGSMRFRWRDFPTSDGEKPDPDRDSEFVAPAESREALLSQWEEAWTILFAALEPLSNADLSRTVIVRGEPHSVMQAINRQVAHDANHVGQIVLLLKHFAGHRWKALTIPRHESASFHQRVAGGEASQR